MKLCYCELSKGNTYFSVKETDLEVELRISKRDFDVLFLFDLVLDLDLYHLP